jgi:hypothetical protein
MEKSMFANVAAFYHIMTMVKTSNPIKTSRLSIVSVVGTGTNLHKKRMTILMSFVVNTFRSLTPFASLTELPGALHPALATQSNAVVNRRRLKQSYFGGCTVLSNSARYIGPTIRNKTGNGPNSSLAATCLIVND